MKLVIQIPCYNEEETLAVALAALPRSVPGFDKVEWLIVDDGSQDETVDGAQRLGLGEYYALAILRSDSVNANLPLLPPLGV